MGIGARWMKTWLGVRFANESIILSYEGVRAIDDSRSLSRVLKTPLGIQKIMTMVKYIYIYQYSYLGGAMYLFRGLSHMKVK